MIPYPEIRPELLELGPFKIRWYGLMYVVGYFVGYRLLAWRARAGLWKVSLRDCENLITYLIVGMLIGARLTYALVYNWEEFSANPVEIFYVWRGGLSFHGALIGMTAALGLFARRRRLPFYTVADAVCFAVPPGLFFGRLGNFINAELYGRPTDVPWAMVFPTDPQRLPRHPSQLYAACLEGLVLFGVVWCVQRWALARKQYRPGLISATLLVGYGSLRFFDEFFRQPDAQLGFVWGPFSMGQLLCFLMILAGTVIAWHHARTQPIFEPKRPSKEF